MKAFPIPANAKKMDSEIGSRLRIFRKAINKTQTDMAEALGVTFQQIQKYEKGVNRLSGYRLTVAAQFLGVTPAEILGLAKNGPSSDTFAALKETAVNQMVLELGKLPRHKQRALALAVIELIAATPH